ncbi:SAM-dependent methyltransferase [Roseospira marina]|uniref:SAM-dependent methyltransferase n=1 Tax=Roseospira marina TaxID=140057 RepID=A0A5M6IGC0_9PROT|nr:class I SAM-dependent methyltransferase [Roseospira marina]KAA5606725.1 SAM-dependent methyltransferase [Roseospira marina]MBB4313859.1 putative O-methyltransferase YrrM [Roseospira marina]MBB5087021.1 putative O-methyltransferase YrrM [Roseospira marina]
MLELSDALAAYVREVGIVEPRPLAALREETERMENAHWASSAEQAALLGFLARLIGARRTLDIGTFTGYSALAVAYALPPEDGEVRAFDDSPAFAEIARRHWNAAGMSERIHLHVGPASDGVDVLIAEGRAGDFDMAFIDADKPAYDGYYEQTLQLVRPGGLIALDNVLWRGTVADPASTGENTVALRALTRKIQDDARVDACLLPIRDGLLLVRRR